jgi:hypothetical protein
MKVSLQVRKIEGLIGVIGIDSVAALACQGVQV